jgi:hypothetical protein
MGRVLFSIWLVLTIMWTAFCVFALGHESRADAMAITLEAALIPAGALLVIGLIFFWAFKGFSSND